MLKAYKYEAHLKMRNPIAKLVRTREDHPVDRMQVEVPRKVSTQPSITNRPRACPTLFWKAELKR